MMATQETQQSTINYNAAIEIGATELEAALQVGKYIDNTAKINLTPKLYHELQQFAKPFNPTRNNSSFQVMWSLEKHTDTAYTIFHKQLPKTIPNLTKTEAQIYQALQKYMHQVKPCSLVLWQSEHTLIEQTNGTTWEGS